MKNKKNDKEESRAKDIEKELDRISRKVDPVIIKMLSANALNKDLKEAVSHQILTGGKRLRPALAILCAQALGGNVDQAIKAAAGIEIFHNYTLIIDDIIDNSTFRRNKPTTWYKYGTNITLCLSIYYASAILRSTILSPHPVATGKVFSDALDTVSEGEITDVLFEMMPKDEPYIKDHHYKNIDFQDYFRMISEKTAFLLSASCQIGAICANASKKETNALKSFGHNIGMAFQIQDDILDIFGEEKKFSKKIGKDIIEKKRGNAVILYALAEFSKTDKEKFMQILNKKTITDKDIKDACLLIGKTQALEKAKKLENDFTKKAKEQLAVLPKNKYSYMLSAIADFIINREK